MFIIFLECYLSNACGQHRHRAWQPERQEAVCFIAQAFVQMVLNLWPLFVVFCADFSEFGTVLGHFWRPGAPWGSLWGAGGAPGEPPGAQRRKSDEKHGSWLTVPGPILEPFWAKNRFFAEKGRSWGVFFAGCCFYRVSVRFLVHFRRPGTIKTPIIAESGIEIQKIKKFWLLDCSCSTEC